MDEKTKSEIEELETLQEIALFGEEEQQQDEAEKAYDELRDKLFCNEECVTPDGNPEEKERKMEDKILRCDTCGKQFTYLAAERDFYEGRGIEEPNICIDCRRDEGQDKSEIKGEGESGGNGGFNS
jgi:hypothetical protein